MKSLFAADETRNIHVPVVDAQIVAFPEEAFDHLNHGAFTKVVSTRFEAEPQYADLRVFPFSVIICTPRVICISLLGKIAERIGNCKS